MIVVRRLESAVCHYRDTSAVRPVNASGEIDDIELEMRHLREVGAGHTRIPGGRVPMFQGHQRCETGERMGLDVSYGVGGEVVAIACARAL